MQYVKELLDQLQEEESKGYTLENTENLTGLYAESKSNLIILAFLNSTNIVGDCLSKNCKLGDTKIRSNNMWDIILLNMFSMIKVRIVSVILLLGINR